MFLSAPSRRAVLVAASSAALAITGVAAAGVISAHHEVTVEVDGVVRPVSGFFRTAGQALAAAGVVVGAHDSVAPAMDATVADGDAVVVRTAHPYTLMRGDEAVTAWSTATTLAKVLGEVSADGVALVADRSTERATLPVVVPGRSVVVRADGQDHEVTAPEDVTTQGLLALAGVTVSPIDRVLLRLDGAQAVLEVTRVTRGTETTTETIARPTEEREDPSLPSGTKRVQDEGVDGSLTRSVYRETIGGEVSVETVVSERRTEPRTRVVLVGTGSVTRTSTASAPASTSAAVGGDVWAALAQCESGGNPATNTGNGYYGLYQFSLPTWRAMGGSGLPSEASAAEQTMRAQMLQQRAGWGQWPACSASLGLR